MDMNVLITDSIAPVCGEMLAAQGIDYDVHLKRSPDELKELLGSYDGWIIRSGTRITADLIDAADRLKVIGRAGVGVDNVDLEAATRRGILVLNAPDGNTISTAEHACAMLMALSRRIPQAHASLRGGAWDRKAFAGYELYGKTLGVVGVGKIGREVALRMKGFGMRVLGYDPVLQREMAERLGIEKAELEQVFAESDYITFHTPLNEHTRGLLNAETLGQCKPGVFLVNCARGGIIDEQDLLDALASGQVGGAALDVYSKEPPEHLRDLIAHPHVVATPHIAASTTEAQEKVARQVTDQVINALQGQPVMTPVNGVAVKMATQPEVQPFLPLAEELGRVAQQLGEGSMTQVTVRCYGDVVRRYAEILTIAALKGVLERVASQPVNYINARTIAEEGGLRIGEERYDSRGNYVNQIEVEVATEDGAHTVGGVLFGKNDRRIVRIDSYDLEVIPEGYLLLFTNQDRPGMVAAVSRLLADAQINIANLSLGRKERGAIALTVLSVDDPIPESVRRQISDVEGVEGVVVVHG